MTFHGETYSRPSLSYRLVALLRSLTRGRASIRAQGTDRGTMRAGREREGQGPLLWALVAFQLVLSALLAAPYGTWFALLILASHVLLCASWFFILSGGTRAMVGLA